ncbi:hypothetical protein ACFQ2Y_45835 [Streptomyces malaysiensis subsp. malaysiensis]
MTRRLHLSFACGDYDRVRALQDGRVRPEGIDLTFLPLGVEETFYRQLRHREFDISELSLSSYSMTLDQDDPPFVALPVFPPASSATSRSTSTGAAVSRSPRTSSASVSARPSTR